jgi:cytochrome c553
MTKITLLSLVAASVLFTACGDDTKKAAAEATAKTTEVAKETASDLEKAAADAAEATKKVAEELAEAAKDLKERAVETTAAAASMAKEAMSDDGAGKAAYAKCSGCHGKDGKTKALGKSEIIAGQSSADIESKLAEYKAGTRNIAGMGTLMKGQVTSMSDDDIKAVSAYISAM